MADIAAFVFYPVDAASNGVTFDCYLSAIDNLRAENADLLPVISANETANATGSGPDGGISPWPVSAAQLRMTAWLDVVREVKGIIWFDSFGATPAVNFAERSRFTRQGNALAPAILGSRSSRRASVSTSAPPRIETMIGEWNCDLYLIAVRVSEVESHANAQNRADPVDPHDVTVTILLPGLHSASVSGSGRTAPCHSRPECSPIRSPPSLFTLSG